MGEEILTETGTETIGELEIDPVCGMTVDTELAEEHDLETEFAERVYFFCGAACRDRFLSEPTLYAVAGRSGP